VTARAATATTATTATTRRDGLDPRPLDRADPGGSGGGIDDERAFTAQNLRHSELSPLTWVLRQSAPLALAAASATSFQAWICVMAVDFAQPCQRLREVRDEAVRSYRS